MLAAELAILSLASACGRQAVQCSGTVASAAPTPSRRVSGVPETIEPDNGERLLQRADPNRKCQFVVESAFAAPYAVWFTQSSDRGEATVSVTVSAAGRGVQELPPVVLDPPMAERLSSVCAAAVQALAAECTRSGHDGSWVHAAHYVPYRGYLMASYWLRRSNHLMRELANLADALRDYAVVPAAFRAEKWIRLQNIINSLHADDRVQSST